MTINDMVNAVGDRHREDLFGLKSDQETHFTVQLVLKVEVTETFRGKSKHIEKIPLHRKPTDHFLCKVNHGGFYSGHRVSWRQDNEASGVLPGNSNTRVHLWRVFCWEL